MMHLSVSQAAAIITILGGIFVILTGILAYVIRFTLSWADVKHDIKQLKEELQNQIADNLRMHGENRESIRRIEDRLNALRDPSRR